MPERGSHELNNDRKGPDSFESRSRLSQEATAADTKFWETTGFKQGSSEFAGTFVAGLSGVITFSAGTAMKRYQLLKAGTIALAPALGGFWKHATKEGMDNMLHLDGKDKSASNNDYLTGALDAVAGITGSMAEQKVSHWYTGYVGRKELTRGSASAAGGLKHEFVSWFNRKQPTSLVSDKCALAEGERILSQDVLPQITHNILRGAAGGFAGSLTWSVPHRVGENFDAIKKDNVAGTLKTIKDVGVDTTIGSIFGGSTAGLITTALNGRYITRFMKAHVEGDEGLTRLDVAYFNDAHSQVMGERNFARASTKITDIREASQALDSSNSPAPISWQDVPENERLARWWNQFIGKEEVMKGSRSYRNDHFYENGDLQNANVTAPFTGWGELEDKIIRKMGPRTKNNDPNRKMGITSQTDGNHSNDQAGGGVNNARRARIISEHNKEAGEKLPLVVGNQDTSELAPEIHELYKDIWRPYIVHELKGPNGKPVKAATIGLVTEEASDGGIKYQDPHARLEQIIANIKKEHPELNIFIVQSHLGDELDRQIAARNKDISVIFGAHSHKAFGTPVWVNNGERDIAILQAGSYLSHVGEANLAFNRNGSLNRFHTTGKLHAVTSDIAEDPVIKKIIDDHIPQDLLDLQNVKYDASTVSKYTLDNARRGENATANVIVDALEADVKDVCDIVTGQSGFIRRPFPHNENLSRYDIDTMVINAGKLTDEFKEQAFIDVTGKKFKEMLEFGVADLNAPQEPGIRGFIKQMFHRMMTGKSLPNNDDPMGNLLHISGSYTYDLTKPVGHRVSNIQIRNKSGQLESLDFDRTYKTLTRWHFIDKSHKSGIFGDQSLKETYSAINAIAYERSIPEVIGEFIRGKRLDPKVHGKLEGRIIDATPQPFSMQYGPGPSIPSFSLLSGRDTMSDDQKTH